MDKSPRDAKNAGLDLSQKWLRHLREAAKTTMTHPCRFCRDRKFYQSEELLWAHITETHPDKVPRDKEAQEKFQETLNGQIAGSMRSRPRDNSANKPHEELAPVESESQKPLRRNLESSRGPPSNPTPLTATGLQTLRTEFKEEGRFDIKHSDILASATIKKPAIGHGRSPSSSVRTTYSNNSLRRIPAKGVSPKQISSPQQGTPLLKTQYPGESEIVRSPATGKRLFEPDSDSPFAAQTPVTNNIGHRPRSSPQQPQHRRGKSSGKLHSQRPVSSGEPGLFSVSVLASSPATKQETPPPDPPKIVRQPDARHISQEQLVAEVKGIYASLVMVEGKCIQVDAKQAALAREAPAGTQPKLNNEQWQALIALHRALLHEHHDFFLTNQHHSGSLTARRLALKYAMPARLWRHGIYFFPELLQNRLPDSLDHMLAFIYPAYSNMAFLHETLTALKETWIECLCDLGRYRMAIEDDGLRDLEIWTQESHQWYLNASDHSPKAGRLYHHLSFLVGPNVLKQLFYYYKALSVPQQFLSAKEFILHLVDPVLSNKLSYRLSPFLRAYIEARTVHFLRTLIDYTPNLLDFIERLEKGIGYVIQDHLEQGYHIALANILNLLSSSFKSAARYVKPLTRILTEFKPNLLFPVYMIFLRGATALPTGSSFEIYDNEMSEGFKRFWEAKAKHFVDQTAGPLLYNVCISFVLIAVHIIIVWLDNGPCKDQNLLSIVTSAMTFGFFYLSIGDRLSDWETAITWIFAASFLMTYIKERLDGLKLTGIHTLSIVAPGVVGAAVLAFYADIKDKWSNRWILASVAVLPCITASTLLWVALLHQTKIIHGIEDGTYVRPVLKALRDICAVVKIWHGIHPSGSAETPPDLEAQAARVTDEKVTPDESNSGEKAESLPKANDNVQPINMNIPKTTNKTRCERQQRYRSQRQRAGEKSRYQNSTLPKEAVAGKSKSS